MKHGFSGLYIDLTDLTVEDVRGEVAAFFCGYGAPAQVDPTDDASDWKNDAEEALVGVWLVASPEGEWIQVFDAAGEQTQRSETWPKALAKYICAETGASIFWYEAWEQEQLPPSDCSGWLPKPRPRPKTLSEPKLTTRQILASPEIRTRASFLAFKIDKPKLEHAAEFGPDMHPPTPRAFRIKQFSLSSVELELPKNVKSLVRPFRGEGRSPTAPTAKKVAAMHEHILKHDHWRRSALPLDLDKFLASDDGQQRRVIEAWESGKVDSDLVVPWFFLSARGLQEALQSEAKRLEASLTTLTDQLVARVGLAAAIGVLGAVRTLELEDLDRREGAATPWWFPGWAFPPHALSPTVWFRIRQWSARADEGDYQAALKQLRASNDAPFVCAGALAFPEAALWREHLENLSTTIAGAGQKPAKELVRLTSLAACATSKREAIELFETRSELANTFEYPTLAHALGPAGFDVIASLRPTSPRAAERRILTLTTFRGHPVREVLKKSWIPSKRAQKHVDEYLDGHG